jgi:hypothetical protein
MAEEIKIWQISHEDKLHELDRSKLNFEARLEKWLDENISILSNELLIIGRQIKTIGGYLDLLCINGNGDLVIVELKRDKTPREVTAQVLDYASWIKDLGNAEVNELANSYLSTKHTTFEEAFNKKFGREIPDVINVSHSMVIVASEFDESTERIIKYLSDSYGVNINVARFQYFRTSEEQELLARFFLIEQSEVDYKAITVSTRKRAPYLTLQQLEEIAENNGVGDLYKRILQNLEGKFIVTTSRTMLNFRGNLDGSIKAIFNLIPERSNSQGLCFQIYFSRFINYTSLGSETAFNLLPPNRKSWKYYENANEDYSGFEGFFKAPYEVDRFLAGLEGDFKG